MFDIHKVLRLSKVLKSWIEQEQEKGHELEDILAACQRGVEDTKQYDLEVRCWAAAAAVVVVAMINDERQADGCDA